MIALYYYATCKFVNIKSITHKFLITGHTQNKGDSVHSVIERYISRTLKSGGKYTPDQYVQIIRSAKKTGESYRVHEITHEDFVSIKYLQNFCEGKAMKRLKISEVKVFKVVKNSKTLSYKMSYKEDFKDIKCFKSIPSNLTLNKLYENLIPLKSQKLF